MVETEKNLIHLNKNFDNNQKLSIDKMKRHEGWKGSKAGNKNTNDTAKT